MTYTNIVSAYIYLKEKKYNNFSQSHIYNTRSRNNLQPTFHRLTSTQQSFSYCAPKAWNSIPQYIKSAASVQIFKPSLKKHLISNY